MLKEAAEKVFFIVLLGLTSPVVWVTCLAALGVFAAASIRRRRVAWRVLSHSSFLILSVSAVAGCWEFFGVGDLAFNLASPLTHKVRIYPVDCRGKTLHSSICCGDLGVPLNPTTFTVSVARQQVFESPGS